MGEDKNKQCKSCKEYEDIICPICGFCDFCHMDSEIEGSCASTLVTQKTDHFKFRVSGNIPTFECSRCGTFKFIVGYTANFETSIKCPKCGAEKAIHEG